MKMTAMAAEFANQIQDSSFYSLGFEERLSMLVTAEWNCRQNNKVTRLIRNAEFSIPSGVMYEIEYHEDHKLDKTQLRLAACKYIEERHHVVLGGVSGNGKTYIAGALGNATCRRMKTIRYIRRSGTAQLWATSATLTALKNQMQPLASQLPEYSVVMGMFGVGDTLEPQLMAEIGDVCRFYSKKALIAYAGIHLPRNNK